jgi:hypothetical protein
MAIPEPTIDILAALTDEAANVNLARPCRIQRWLDGIADETPGKAELAATLTTTDPKSEHYRPLDVLDRLTHRLGLITSVKTLGDHRAGRCRCRS